MKVTFDTNTIDQASDPSRFPDHPSLAAFIKIRDALNDGIIEGYFSDTFLTLESIEKDDRPDVLAALIHNGGKMAQRV